MSEIKLSEVERIKIESNYLRGNIVEDLANPITAGVSEDNQQLMKLHGSYQQQDRDLDEERRKQKLDSLLNEAKSRQAVFLWPEHLPPR